MEGDGPTQRARFERSFGPAEALVRVRAPGRVNLIGEHTDYHDGWVLPAAVEPGVTAIGRARVDRRVAVRSETFGEVHAFSLDEPTGGAVGWARRAEGVLREVLCEEGDRGVEVLLDADLPVGGGLSSSAASMAAVGALAARLVGREREPLSFARALRDAEHRYAGVRCGIMDPLAVLLGRPGHAVFIDCRTLEWRHVRVPPAWAIVIIDSGVRHDLASSEYNRRQEECAAVLALVRKRRGAVAALRDVTREDLDVVAGEADPVGLRRCRYVLDENRRVHEALCALERCDSEAVGRLLAASHRGLRDEYSVSCPALDLLVDLAVASPGCVGSRMTGGGFGGSTVSLVMRERVAAFVKSVTAGYRDATGSDARATVTTAAGGLASGLVEGWGGVP